MKCNDKQTKGINMLTQVMDHRILFNRIHQQRMQGKTWGEVCDSFKKEGILYRKKNGNVVPWTNKTIADYYSHQRKVFRTRKPKNKIRRTKSVVQVNHKQTSFVPVTTHKNFKKEKTVSQKEEKQYDTHFEYSNERLTIREYTKRLENGKVKIVVEYTGPTTDSVAKVLLSIANTTIHVKYNRG
jgi:hypothetical protein